MTKLLFILKKRAKGNYGTWSYSEGDMLDSGLFISAKQVVDMLRRNGVEAELEQAVDNNCIDRLVHKHKPTHVIIEAFWVVPEKFEVLKKLHKKVEWIVRCHSKVDFLAQEGGVIGWVVEYLKNGVKVSANDLETVKDFKKLAKLVGANPADVLFHPNYYDTTGSCQTVLRNVVQQWKRGNGHWVAPVEKVAGQFNVGCFGAIRPLKNHMAQALAAINAANELGLDLRFHISSNRVEGKGDAALKAMRALFSKMTKHQLVEVPWKPHAEFVAYIRHMDIVMQVSVSETFNIVSADAVYVGVPTISSDQVPWLPEEYVVKHINKTKSITDMLVDTWNASGSGILTADQLIHLNDYTTFSKHVWLDRYAGSCAPITPSTR